MGLQDRDYMRRGNGEPPLKFPDLTPRSWWKRIKWKAAAAIAGTVLALGSAAIWLIRDVSSFASSDGPREGSLIVNINTATQEQLESLPQIGAARASLIIANRPYQSIDDLKRLNAIPDGVIDDLRPLLRVDGETQEGE
jgi:hypothetical protein